MFVLQILIYGFCVWFGLYLLHRNPAKAGLRATAFGLLAYALALGFDVLASQGGDTLRLRDALILAPAVLWVGAVLNLTPQPPNPIQQIIVPAATGLVLLVLAWQQLYPLAAVIAGLFPLVSLIVVLASLRSDENPRRPAVVALAATLFFGMGVGSLLFPVLPISRGLMITAIGFDLLILGGVVAILDAYDEGENFWQDALRSLLEALTVGVLTGGQVGLVMIISGGERLPFTVLILSLTFVVFGLLIFLRRWQTVLDVVVFQNSGAASERADLRGVSEAISRRAPAMDMTRIEEKEFTRLTRRALSHMGDLSRLASNPLIYLPVLDEHIQQEDNTLARARALRQLLIESITRLKPESDGDFNTSDAWRYYNALYFPYVIGLKPFSRSVALDELDPTSREALAWFQSQVPERTLYNWQNKGAELIALDLRETLVNADNVPE